MSSQVQTRAIDNENRELHKRQKTGVDPELHCVTNSCYNNVPRVVDLLTELDALVVRNERRHTPEFIAATVVSNIVQQSVLKRFRYTVRFAFSEVAPSPIRPSLNANNH